MIDLLYVADANCGWYYGFSATARELASDPRVALSVKHGALCVGDRAAPISAYPHIPGANARISALTVAQFGTKYEAALAHGELVIDSDDAAKGLMALRLVAGEDRAVEALSFLQRAFYIEGISMSDPAAYEWVAVKMSLDTEAVLDGLKDPPPPKPQPATNSAKSSPPA